MTTDKTSTAPVMSRKDDIVRNLCRLMNSLGLAWARDPEARKDDSAEASQNLINYVLGLNDPTPDVVGGDVVAWMAENGLVITPSEKDQLETAYGSGNRYPIPLIRQDSISPRVQGDADAADEDAQELRDLLSCWNVLLKLAIDSGYVRRDIVGEPEFEYLQRAIRGIKP